MDLHTSVSVSLTTQLSIEHGQPHATSVSKQPSAGLSLSKTVTLQQRCHEVDAFQMKLCKPAAPGLKCTGHNNHSTIATFDWMN